MYYCLSQPYCQTTSKVKDDSIYHWPIQYNNEKNEDSPKENIWLATSSKESTTTRYYTQDLNRCSIIHVFPPFPIKFSPKEDYWRSPPDQTIVSSTSTQPILEQGWVKNFLTHLESVSRPYRLDRGRAEVGPWAKFKKLLKGNSKK